MVGGTLVCMTMLLICIYFKRRNRNLSKNTNNTVHHITIDQGGHGGDVNTDTYQNSNNIDLVQVYSNTHTPAPEINTNNFNRTNSADGGGGEKDGGYDDDRVGDGDDVYDAYAAAMNITMEGEMETGVKAARGGQLSDNQVNGTLNMMSFVAGQGVNGEGERPRGRLSLLGNNNNYNYNHNNNLNGMATNALAQHIYQVQEPENNDGNDGNDGNGVNRDGAESFAVPNALETGARMNSINVDEIDVNINQGVLVDDGENHAGGENDIGNGFDGAEEQFAADLKNGVFIENDIVMNDIINEMETAK